VFGVTDGPDDRCTAWNYLTVNLTVIANCWCICMSDDDMLQIQMHNLPQGAAARIATAMFQHVHCQSHKQPDRSVIYKILQACIQKRSEGG
jgi:hypothetical protein